MPWHMRTFAIIQAFAFYFYMSQNVHEIVQASFFIGMWEAFAFAGRRFLIVQVGQAHACVDGLYSIYISVGCSTYWLHVANVSVLCFHTYEPVITVLSVLCAPVDIRRHTHTHAYIFIYLYFQIYINICIYYAAMHAYRHAQVHINVHGESKCTHTRIHTWRHTHTYISKYVWTQQTQMHRDACTYTYFALKCIKFKIAMCIFDFKCPR